MSDNKETTRLAKVWVTKYALSQGVKIYRNVTHYEDGDMICLNDTYRTFIHNPDWHTTRKAAVARLEKIIEKKLKSLDKEMAKIEAMTAEVITPQ